MFFLKPPLTLLQSFGAQTLLLRPHKKREDDKHTKNSGPHKLLCWLHACRSDQNHLSFKLVKIVSIACGQPLCKRYITTQMSILYDEDYYD